ncbi:electron transport complex subunit RsxC [Marinospirillum sp. MEB164]|uniref:Ion-translocating oxidoreductase complex subunit C n=1 Tax=Marinospirillum alkalitolerans TaxID=3123374 RepID=A0ABW8PZU2_9GAMM
MSLSVRRQPIGRFHGGIHPAEHKAISAKSPLRSAPLAAEVILPLGKRPDRLATPCVAIGEQVQRNQVIASSDQLDIPWVHASLSGEVIAIEARPVAGSAQPLPCIVLHSDGQDLARPSQPLAAWSTADPAELWRRIMQGGLSGLGGAAFPSALKLQGAHQQGIRALIINAAECEPYITADDALMRTRPTALLEGMAILNHLLQPEQLMIGIEDNKPEAIAALETALQTEDWQALAAKTQLVILPTLYPSGGEKQLIQLLTGEEVPDRGRPLDLGLLCHNVGTLVALADAVIRDQPLIERLVTVTGAQVAHPGNYLVRLGTPMQHLLDLAGYRPSPTPRLILGGPMMGQALPSSQFPITPGCNCLLLPSVQELPLPGPELPCIRCSRCEEVCPAQLLPQQLYFYAKGQDWEQLRAQQLQACIECAACAWVCPSEIPLVDYYRHAKAELAQRDQDALKAEQAKQRFEARQARLERDAAEKEAKRQARAAAAQAVQQQAAPAVKAVTPTTTAAVSTPPSEAAAAIKEKTSATSTIQPQTPPQTVAASAPVDEKRLKQLKIAQAAAQVALKKARKTLQNLQADSHTPAEQLAEQEARVAAAEAQAAKAAAQLAEAETTTSETP